MVQGSCAECSDFDQTPAAALMVLILAPAAIIFLYHRSTGKLESWSKPANAVGVLVYLALLHSQAVGTIAGCSFITLPTSSSGLFEMGSYSLTPGNLLNLECPRIIQGFQSEFVYNAFLPLWVGIMFLVTTILAKAVAMATRGMGGKVNFIFTIRNDAMFSVYASVFFSFFLSIIQNALLLLQYYEHPLGNSELSLRSHPHILVRGTEWNKMLAVCILALLVFCVCPFTGMVWIIKIAPSRFVEEPFRVRWKFLFAKVNPACYGWSPVMPFKALLFCLTTIFFPKNTDTQLLWLAITISLYLMLVQQLRPWRSGFANILDVCIQLFDLGIIWAFRDLAFERWTNDGSLRLIMTYSVLPFVCTGLGVVVLVVQHLKMNKARNISVAEKQVALLSQACQMQESSVKTFSLLTDQDQQKVRTVCSILFTELSMQGVAFKPNVRLKSTLVATELCSQVAEENLESEIIGASSVGHIRVAQAKPVCCV